MIKTVWYFDDDFNLVLTFDTGGLTGNEEAGTLKQALESMAIEVPCRTFVPKYNAGEFEGKPLTEAYMIADAVNIVSDLWQYDMILNPEGKDLRPYMTPLHLLRNAMNLLVIKQHEINKLKSSMKK